MHTRQKALKVVSDAVAKLSALVSEASVAGDFDTVVEVGSWARLIASLSGPSAGVGSPATGATPPPPATTRRHAPVASGTNGQTVHHPASRITKAKNTADTYPRFHRQGDQLVKIGWSKSQREEYQHKAPRRAVELVVAALQKVGAAGRLIRPDQIIPLHDAVEGGDIPIYQVYVTMAWLRALGLLATHGRSGYSFKQGVDLGAAARERWEKLDLG